MEQPVARDLLQSLAAGIMLVEPQQAATTHSARILPLPTQAKRELSTTQTPKKTSFGSKLEAKVWSKNEAIFGFA